MKTKTSSLSRPVTELEYGPTGISDGVHGELHAAPAYGDLAHGPHGTFIKMPAIREPYPHAYRGLLGGRGLGRHGQQEAGQPRCTVAGRLLLLPEGRRAPCHQVRLAERMHLLRQSERQVRLP